MLAGCAEDVTVRFRLLGSHVERWADAGALPFRFAEVKDVG